MKQEKRNRALLATLAAGFACVAAAAERGNLDV